MRYYLDAFRNYANVKGRATRKELWMFILFNLLVSYLIGVLELLLGLVPDGSSRGYVGSLYYLAALCPAACLNIRRLHDVNRTGWWFALIFVPFANFYLVYLLWFKKGTPGINNYGAPSKAAAAPAAYTVPVDNSFSSYEMCPAPKPAGEEPAAPKPELPQMRKKCPSCGTELKVAAKFCSECGAPQD